MEVTEKIARGLNEMAEQAAMLNKLCRPLELQMARRHCAGSRSSGEQARTASLREAHEDKL